MINEVLRFSHVRARVGDRTILKDVSFQVFNAEVHGVLGISTVNYNAIGYILSGTLFPESGEIFINDKLTKMTSTHDAHNNGVYCIHPESSLVQNLSIAENIAIQDTRHHSFFLTNKYIRQKYKDIMVKVCPDIPITTPVSKLSSYEQLIIQIVKALSFNAKLIVFNYIVDRLSEMETVKLIEILDFLKVNNVSSLIVTNNIHKGILFCDRMTVLHNGISIKIFPRSEFIVPNILSSLTGGAANELELSNSVAAIDSIAIEMSSKEPLLQIEDMIIENHLRSPVNMTLYQGEIVGLIDLEGNLSESIIDAIFGILDHKQKRMLVNNNEVFISNPNDAITEGIAYLQNSESSWGYLPSLTVMENIFFPLIKKSSHKIGILRRKFLRNEAMSAFKTYNFDETTKFAELAEFPQHSKDLLKTILARIDLYYSRILLMNNPTIGLNYVDSKIIYNHMFHYAGAGNAVLFVSSDLAEILNVCNRYYIISKGNIIEKQIAKFKDEGSK